MGKRSKRYKAEAQKVSKEPVSLAEAVEKIKSFSNMKFDQSVECVLNLGIDPKQADQMVRGSLSLPHGIGKTKKVIAFCEEADEAKKAGAIEAGVDELVKKISDGWMDFDVAIASPKVHVVVGKQSFDSKKLVENIEAFLEHIKRIKPSSAKGTYIKKMALSATMSPAVNVIV
jgi:large subunit ribosomal protein L1